MTFFSRSDAMLDLAVARRACAPRQRGSGFFGAIASFVEDLGILFRYAAGLDYYGRGKLRLRD